MRRLASNRIAVVLAVVVGLVPAVAGAEEGRNQPEPGSPSPASSETGVQPKLATQLNEEIVKLPIKVRAANGALAEREIVVTLFKPSGPGPFPIAIFNHGRNPLTRSTFGRSRIVGLADVLVRRNFAVLMPTRLGYGDSGYDIDPEKHSGRTCEAYDYTPLQEAHAAQVKVVLNWAAGQDWADAERVVLAGVSAGGFGSVTSAAKGIPGVVGVINFAGGIGGSRDERRLHKPCNPDNVGEKYAEAGRASDVPSLWLYSENDALWGSDIPRTWFKSYIAAGGKGEFHMLPPLGDDGHNILEPGFKLWRPLMDRFLEKIGFAAPRNRISMAASGYAKLQDTSKVPLAPSAAQSGAYEKFLARDVPRAFVISPNGGWAMHTGDAQSLEKALAFCRKRAGQDCRPYAVDDAVVWQP